MATQTFEQAARKALTAETASPERATKGLSSSDDHKRYFLQTFRRWSLLFKRKEGNMEDDKWLIAEYYKSLCHLSEKGFDTLTDVLKQTHTFFPTVKECLDATRCDRYDWGHPFLSLHQHGGPNPLLRRRAPPPISPPSPTRSIEYDGEYGDG